MGFHIRTPQHDLRLYPVLEYEFKTTFKLLEVQHRTPHSKGGESFDKGPVDDRRNGKLDRFVYGICIKRILFGIRFQPKLGELRADYCYAYSVVRLLVFSMRGSGAGGGVYRQAEKRNR